MRNFNQGFKTPDSRPYRKFENNTFDSSLSQRPSQTLYVSQKDVTTALSKTIEILKESEVNQDPEGFCSIDEVCEKLKQIAPELSYINRNHIVELFFKDKDRKIMVSGRDLIKYKEIRYVQPPTFLYFGTLTGLVSRMMQFGIKSSTKGYIKLYSSLEAAAEFGKRFVTLETDTVTILKIDALKAFSEGLKFSTFKDGEYIVVRLDQRYLKGPVEMDGAVEIPELPSEIL